MSQLIKNDQWTSLGCQLSNEFITILPDRLVTGNDLISIGLKPSEQFGIILRFLFDSQLEGKFDSKETGLQYWIDNRRDFGMY